MEQRWELHRQLDRIHSVLLELLETGQAQDMLQPLVLQLQELSARLRDEQLNLALLGQFKRGKSSLLNALLRSPVVPTSILPLTSIPTYVRYGKTPDITVSFQNGTQLPVAREAVQQVDITHDAPLLEKGLVIIDTPGIGSTYCHNTNLTRAFLKNCDGAVFLLSSDPPPTNLEMEFLKEIQHEAPRILFVLNKMDCLSPGDRDEMIDFLKMIVAQKVMIHRNVLNFFHE